MNIVMSILMLTAIALIAGAIVYWRKTGERKKPILMVVLAGVAIVNVAIWTVPDASGEAPLDQVQAIADQADRD